MAKATVTREVEESGRVTIPEDARKALGIDGETAIVEMKLRTGEDIGE
jgi:bifunctional DNA-binding transcriptional regulator/antitoxin component of YhaV-PrlF toxin-antitoxin module